MLFPAWRMAAMIRHSLNFCTPVQQENKTERVPLVSRKRFSLAAWHLTESVMLAFLSRGLRNRLICRFLPAKGKMSCLYNRNG